MHRALHLLAASEQTRLRAEIPRVPAEQRDWDANVAVVREALEPEVFERVWEKGAELDQEGAIELALGEESVEG